MRWSNKGEINRILYRTYKLNTNILNEEKHI